MKSEPIVTIRGEIQGEDRVKKESRKKKSEDLKPEDWVRFSENEPAVDAEGCLEDITSVSIYEIDEQGNYTGKKHTGQLHPSSFMRVGLKLSRGFEIDGIVGVFSLRDSVKRDHTKKFKSESGQEHDMAPGRSGFKLVCKQLL